MASHIKIGTAAWAIPKETAQHFPQAASNLERYAQRFNAVEINTSFYRDHKPATYAKWAAMVPGDFRFAVKLSQEFTHNHRLASSERLPEVIAGIAELGKKLGVILVQLPPSLAYDDQQAPAFFAALRALYQGTVAFEPRHASWLSPAGQQLFASYNLAKVVADPDPCPAPELTVSAAGEGAYFRLHGVPVIYRSDYSAQSLALWTSRVRACPARTVWCIFDNTALGHATANALTMLASMEGAA